MNKTRVLILFLVVLILSILEYAAYYHPAPWAVLASRTWGLMAIVYFISSFVVIVRNFIVEARSKFFLGTITFIMFAVVLAFPLSSLKSIPLNKESTQQVAAGLASFSRPDWNYTSADSFLYYPNRQYLLVAWPSLLFTRHPVTLRLGYSLIFLVGFGLFYLALKNLLPPSSTSPPLAAVGSLLAVTSPLVAAHLFQYEQSLLPLAFTLQIVYWFQKAYFHPKFLTAVNLIWVGSLLGTMYTPALASWLLLISLGTFIGFLHFTKHLHLRAFFWTLCLLPIVTFGLLSFATRRDLTSLSPSRIWTPPRFYEGFKSAISPSPSSLLPFLLVPFALLYLVSSSLFLNGPLHWWVGLWVIGVVLVAEYLHGYNPGSPAFALHRAMIVLPPTIAGIFLWLGSKTQIQRAISPPSAAVAWAIVAAVAVFSYRTVLSQLAGTPSGYITASVLGYSTQKPPAANRNTQVFLFTTDSETQSLSAALIYFFPHSQVILPGSDCQLPPAPLSPVLVFIETTHPCYTYLISNYRPSLIPVVSKPDQQIFGFQLSPSI